MIFLKKFKRPKYPILICLLILALTAGDLAELEQAILHQPFRG
jgi:hypothetical protein